MWWLWFYLEFGISAACLMIKLCKIVTEPLLKMEFWMVGLVWWSVSGPLRPGGALWCKLARFRESENGKRHQGEILTQTSKQARPNHLKKRAYFQQNTYGLLINDPPFYFAFGCTKPKEEKKNKSLSLRQFPRLHAVREVSSCLYTMHASDSLSSQVFFNTT